MPSSLGGRYSQQKKSQSLIHTYSLLEYLVATLMCQYNYSSLLQKPNAIRLLRLLPSKDESADIQCELFDYSLDESYGAHLYEALSYV